MEKNTRDRREYHREYMRMYRKRKKKKIYNVNLTLNNRII